MRGFLLDLNRCTGCHACLLACSIENGLKDGETWRSVFTFNARHRPGIATYHMSLGCLHCGEPACMNGCPTLAYSRHHATGAVLIDRRLCIGCRYCTWACPYDALRYTRGSGTVAKCTLCNERLLEGGNPACSSLCPTGALQFTELAHGNGMVRIPGFPDPEIGPSIRIVPLRSSATGPDLSAEPPRPLETSHLDLDTKAAPGITMDTEWSLVFFSLATALLVGIANAAMFGTLRVNPFDFLLAALGTLGVSTLHLGARRRAWRAVLNLRKSWLSREVVSYLVFMVVTALALLGSSRGSALRWPAALCGFVTLYCVDRVYCAVAASRSVRFHSAGGLITGIFLSGLLLHHDLLAGLAGLAKLVLYADRQSWFKGPGRFCAAALRMSLGFAAPLALWQAFPEWILPAALIGEVIDRCEFYTDIELPSPRRRIALDLGESIAGVYRGPEPDDSWHVLGARTSRPR